MKKRLFALIMAVVAVAGLLTGCHGARGLEEFSIPEEFDESQSYEITFWAKNDTNKAQTNIYQQAIDDFQKLYPNITVTLKLYTDYKKIYNDVITNISTNTTPNVCITYPDHIATYLTGQNVVVPLDELMSNESYGLGGSSLKFDSVELDEVIPQFLNEGNINGVQYALPYMRSTEACYVNKTYVEALGYTLPESLTWDFVWEVSEAAVKQDEDGNYLINGQKVMIPFIYKSTDNMMIQMLKQREAGYSTSEGEILLDNEVTRELLMTVAEHTESGAFSTFKISSYPANYLNAGQCIFAIDSTAGATWMGCNAPLSDISEENLVEFETEVMAIPQFDTENPCMISQGPSICLFNKADEQEVLASWLFAQFLLTNDIQIGYAQTEGYVPVTSKAQNSEEYQDYLSRAGEDNETYYDVKIKASSLLLNNVEYTFTTPVFNGSASLRDAAGQLIEETAKSVRRKQEINEEYFDSLFEDVSALYRIDSNSSVSEEKEDLGPLPGQSKALIICLVVIWLAMGAYVISGNIKKRKQ